MRVRARVCVWVVPWAYLPRAVVRPRQVWDHPQRGAAGRPGGGEGEEAGGGAEGRVGEGAAGRAGGGIQKLCVCVCVCARVYLW